MPKPNDTNNENVRQRNIQVGTVWNVLPEDAQPGTTFSQFPPMYPQHDDKFSKTCEVENSKDAPLTGSVLQQLKGDYYSIALLLLLYLLQGIPIGLTGSIPLVLQSRHTSYKEQALFSFAYWPFSLKLLWAPIVDSCFWSWLGRRKSWLVPVQYLLGGLMFILSQYVTSVLGDHDTEAKPDVRLLTGIFFGLNFLAATQDIAVDGWALTMLSKRNVSWASTCNAVGQTAGYFIGNVVFLALESAEFCNKWIRSEDAQLPYGIVTLSKFVYFWGIIYIVITTLLLVFKREKQQERSKKDEDHRMEDYHNEEKGELDNLGLLSTYWLLWDILRLKPVFSLAFVLFTAKIGFAAADGITGLKLVEQGVPKDRLALLAIPLVPLQIILPWIIGKWTSGPRPLRILLRAYPYRLAFGLIYAAVVYWTPSWKQGEGVFPIIFYIMIIGIYCVHQITVYSTFVALMAFFARVSDPMVGGTYMTLLNTINNMGVHWPITFSLSILEKITWKNCWSDCANDAPCTIGERQCVVILDGYYILSVLCPVLGFIWWLVMRHRVDRLQDYKEGEWRVRNS